MAHFPHGAIAAAHTERKRKRMEEEEEKMTTYNRDELDNNWEFKIVRSDSRAFKNPETLQVLLEEEAMSGWEMLEKLDDHRVRFKRPKSARNNDFSLPPGIDPYRSRYGRSIKSTEIFIALLLVTLGVGAAVYFQFTENSTLADIDWGTISMTIPIIGSLVVLIGVSYIIKRRR